MPEHDTAQPPDHVQLAKRATEQIRDALVTLAYAADGHYEDTASVALDALDWLEDELGLPLVSPSFSSQESPNT